SDAVERPGTERDELPHGVLELLLEQEKRFQALIEGMEARLLRQEEETQSILYDVQARLAARTPFTDDRTVPSGAAGLAGQIRELVRRMLPREAHILVACDG